MFISFLGNAIMPGKDTFIASLAILTRFYSFPMIA